MNTVIIETLVSIVANLAITLIGVFGAWLVAQIGKSQQLNTINTAVGELTNAAETTVLELQQTVVEEVKTERYRLKNLMNVRKKPDGEIIATKPAGTVVQVVGIEKNWLHLADDTYILYEDGKWAERL